MAPNSKLTFFLIELLAGVALVSSQKPRNVFKVCSRSDPELNNCIVNSINCARSKLMKGIPELGMEPIDPLHVDEIRVEDGPDNYHLRLRIYNATWSGISTFVVKGARLDLERRTMEIKTTLSHMGFVGLYKFGGRLFALGMTSNGNFNTDFYNLNSTHSVNFEEVQINGVTHWRVKKWVWDVEAGNVVVYYRNLFNGNKELERFAKKFMNANWRDIWKIHGHICEREFGRVFSGYVNKFFEKIPLSELFKD